ncbi:MULTISPECIES: DUF2969 family protein [Fructobacillus]|uniref:DUF2969 domain-containing protein n=2 Tax=Fructobacillus TaxID=559173 RepID=A0ABY5BZD2_9LACO|nr:DUF2969 family protein [Fructobacillus americanaquae]CAK1234262.1 hypothetical protein R53534_HOPDCFKK_00494 [Fructobacillus sp. LMG 32999]USS91707.1 DUF2969 domain-containing protein [Fructobacillus americanaquae]CAK1234946.1 hypothetical protein R55203_MFJFHIJN_00539 [Fructobacillus sp. LMG 32999]CAK1235475.1 hypothetical protein R55250_KEHBDPNM_00976 [Fructobacillus sp. LMG 32999]CAK1239115.1 hypothetical protein R55214_HHFBAMCI_00735 [Fructobacillus sp. LMG 32999]
MSKKNQSFGVSLVTKDDEIQVLVDDQPIGKIEQNQGSYTGVLGKQVVIASAQSTDEALQAILASFNLYH